MTMKSWLSGVSALAILIATCGSASAALTGQYLFEEGSGTTATDTSGNLRNGTLTGAIGTPDYVPGLYQGSTSALRFNYDTTTMGYINANIHRVALPVADFAGDAPGLTLMAWVRPDAIADQGAPNAQGGSSRSIVGLSNGGVATQTRGILQLISATGQVRMLGRRSDGVTNSSSYLTAGTTPFAATVGQSYFLVGIMDYAAADIRVYVNGVQHTGGTQGGFANLGGAGNSSATNSLSAHIGTNTGGAGEQFNGLIDGVRIYDEVLTAQQILDIYTAEKISVLDTSFDADTDTDGDDLLIWQRNLGLTTGALNSQGDSDADGDVDATDLQNWRNRYGFLTSEAAAAPVPEPAGLGLAVFALFGLAAKRRRAA